MIKNKFGLFVVFIACFITSINFLPRRKHKYFCIIVFLTCLIKKSRITISNIMHIGQNIRDSSVHEDNFGMVLKGTVPDGASLTAARDAGAAVFAYGSFITAIINFLIIAFVVFMLVKMVNKMKGPAPAAAPSGPSELDVLLQIRDSLKK